MTAGRYARVYLAADGERQLMTEDGRGEPWPAEKLSRGTREQVYLAFRLAMQGEQWWGTANNLQRPDANPWEIARDLLLERVDFTRLAESDRGVLERALWS